MPPIKIREANEWLVRLRDEAATGADRAEFEAWLEADPCNRQAFARVSRAVRDVSGLGGDLRDYLETERARLPARRAFAAASLAAAVLVLGFGYAALAPKTYTTAVGEQSTVELTDGSRVELNTNTRLSVRYAEDSRRIRLERGEAVFDVAHDRERPFIVQARGQSVRAVGTQFAVRVDRDALSVLVIEGIVAVDAQAPRTADAPTAPPPPRLVAGQKLDLADATPAIALVPVAEIRRSLSWREGMLQFDGETLAFAAGEVARYTGARFVIDDRQTEQLRVWAYFRAADLDGFLSSLEQNSPGIAIRREGDEVRIGRRDGAPAN